MVNELAPPDISLVIPAYNEEKVLAATIYAALDFFSTHQITFEILVIDDGSTDSTSDIVKNKFGNNKQINLFKLNKNYGKGHAIKMGMSRAVGKYWLFMDADHSVNITNLSRFLFVLNQSGVDIAIASVEIGGSKLIDRNLFYRKILGKLAKLLIRATLHLGVYDTQRGFKVFSAEAGKEIFPALTINRWGFDMELLLLAKNKGFVIKELSVDWENGSNSSVSIFSYISTLFELVKIKYRQIRGFYR